MRTLQASAILGALLLASPAALAQSDVPNANSPFLPIQVLAEITAPDTGNRYQLLSITDYLNANKFAVDNGGWLWAINSRAEQEFVITSFAAARENYRAAYALNPVPGYQTDPDLDYYIGLTDSEYFGGCGAPSCEGSFRWLNGDPVTFTNWNAGEPNNVGVGTGLGDDPNGEDYGEVYPEQGVWNDDNDRGSGLNGLPPSSPTSARLPAGGNLAVVEYPPLPPPGYLEVDPNTGFARFVSQLDVPLEFYSYNIGSATGALNAGAWLGSNLDARNVDADDPALPGQSWDVINASSGQLFEAFLLGGSPLPARGSIVLGKIMNPVGAGPQPTLSFDVATSNRNPNIAGVSQVNGLPVQYASFSVSVAGDYNGDGLVNAADYTIWRDTLGSTTDLRADGNGDGSVTQADYTVWSSNYGASFSQSGSTAIPEPAAALVAAAGLLAASRRR